MAKIPLANSPDTTIVDDGDYEWLMRYTWYLDDATGCAVTYVKEMQVEMGTLIAWRVMAEELLKEDCLK
jgi:hypothetical protein